MEIRDLIKVGLDSPKLYKRSVWNAATKIMEVLADGGGVTRCNKGPGLAKYQTLSSLEALEQAYIILKK